MRQTEHNYITRVAWNKNNGAASSVLTESWSSHINMITCTLCYISVCDMFMNWRPQNVLMGEEFNVGWLTVAPYMLLTAHLRRIQPSWKDESVHTYTLWLNGCFILTNEERFFFSHGAVRSSAPSHPFTTPTTWSWPTAFWVPHGANWIKCQLL